MALRGGENVIGVVRVRCVSRGADGGHERVRGHRAEAP